MYAIIKHGGKQYKVSEGDFLNLDHFNAEVKSSVEITEVLAVLGNPNIPIQIPSIFKFAI